MVVNYQYWAIQNQKDANSYVKAMIVANGGSNVFSDQPGLQNLSSLQNLVTLDPNKDYDSMYVQWAKYSNNPSVQAGLERSYGLTHQMINDYEYWAIENHKDANSYIKEMIAANGGSNVFPGLQNLSSLQNLVTLDPSKDYIKLYI